jgi:hypothetical protein
LAKLCGRDQRKRRRESILAPGKAKNDESPIRAKPENERKDATRSSSRGSGPRRPCQFNAEHGGEIIP